MNENLKNKTLKRKYKRAQTLHKIFLFRKNKIQF